MKLVAFRNAIGSQGREILNTLGYVEGTTDYDGCVLMLQGHFEGDDSIFVKTQRFVTVRQAAGERSRDYLLRVEQLSRQLAFPGGTNDVRLNLCMEVAVNGLRSEALRTKMIGEQGLTWENLRTQLLAHERTEETRVALSLVAAGSEPTKEEPVWVK